MLPAFPPKKLFSLTPAEVEQRREQLEKYMQAGEWSARTLGWLCGGLWGNQPAGSVGPGKSSMRGYS